MLLVIGELFQMPHTGIAQLPLHGGPAPPWLFARMVKLARAIIDVTILDYDHLTLLERLSDPFWFQAFSCVLGFDWHSSGTTTVTCAALKEALDPAEHGIAVAGGKGRASRRAQSEIEHYSELFGLTSSRSEQLKYASRLSAKVDSAAVQDGYQLYHHAFIMTERGEWAVIQQGFDAESAYARRYHWCYDSCDDFVVEPHAAILGERCDEPVLDMTALASEGSRKSSVDLFRENPSTLRNIFSELIPQKAIGSQYQSRLDSYTTDGPQAAGSARVPALLMPVHMNWELMRGLYEFQPCNYEELLGFKGVGPATVRALALIGELIYGESPSWNDPVKFSFAVGGKDGVPYPVDRKAMDESIEMLETGIAEARLGDRERLRAVNRLRAFVPDDRKIE